MGVLVLANTGLSQSAILLACRPKGSVEASRQIEYGSGYCAAEGVEGELARDKVTAREALRPLGLPG